MLRLDEGTTVRLESGVTGDGVLTLPFWISADVTEGFVDRVRAHDSVADLNRLHRVDGCLLYSLTWDIAADAFVEGLVANGVEVLTAVGRSEAWEFDLRFPGRDALADFRTYCDDRDVSVVVERMYNPTKPGTGPWFGLTDRQRRTLQLAVRRGYYDIPCRCTTVELAEALGISDQAVTERLRRGIVAFVTNALLAPESDDEAPLD
ncbi:helix-turn-helix domain-containing protein [Haloplanus sp. GCM10025708]|uniref:helix-turn-helix domain-containing protein n=1 Tax=Haloferacaceae TaxID=1644056 RepID=UPI003606F077